MCSLFLTRSKQRIVCAKRVLHLSRTPCMQVVDFYKGLGFEADPDGIKCAPCKSSTLHDSASACKKERVVRVKRLVVVG